MPPPASDAGPIRQCAGCRQRRPVASLHRFAVTNGGSQVTLDPGRRLPGRGAHICRDTWVACVVQARRRRGLARALRVGNDVIERSQLEDALTRIHEEHNSSPPSRS
ncbi:MAG: YlxR family protein [Candidatus Dormibacteria bacterium]